MLVALALFARALWVAQSELTAHPFHDVVTAQRTLGPGSIVLAISLAGISYGVLLPQSGLRLAMISKPLALKNMWRAAFSANALGNALGFSFATRQPHARGSIAVNCSWQRSRRCPR